MNTTITAARAAFAIAVVSTAALVSASVLAQDPFADEVVSFTPGTGAGFGADKLPAIVLGPPVGAGATEGSLDVLSLGNNGTVVLAFRDRIICDGDGPDFTVFENAFHAGAPDGPIFTEVGIVAVSEDGVQFVEFPYDPVTFAGLAGKTPVFSNPTNGIDPTDPTVSGGDSFDLATVGLTRAAYVRITDPGASIPDVGSQVPSVNQAGFDLDAIAAVHDCDPNGATATPTHPATSTPTATETPTLGTPIPGDADGNRVVDERDLGRCAAEIFDGDGDAAAAVGGGTIASAPGVDANGDGKVSAADCAQIAHLVASSGSQ